VLPVRPVLPSEHYAAWTVYSEQDWSLLLLALIGMLVVHLGEKLGSHGSSLPQSSRLLRNDDSGVHGLAIPNFTVDGLLVLAVIGWRAAPGRPPAMLMADFDDSGQ